jgi:hypothetical protein
MNEKGLTTAFSRNNWKFVVIVFREYRVSSLQFGEKEMECRLTKSAPVIRIQSTFE